MLHTGKEQVSPTQEPPIVYIYMCSLCIFSIHVGCLGYRNANLVCLHIAFLCCFGQFCTVCVYCGVNCLPNVVHSDRPAEGSSFVCTTVPTHARRVTLYAYSPPPVPSQINLHCLVLISFQEQMNTAFNAQGLLDTCTYTVYTYSNALRKHSLLH